MLSTCPYMGAIPKREEIIQKNWTQVVTSANKNPLYLYSEECRIRIN